MKTFGKKSGIDVIIATVSECSSNMTSVLQIAEDAVKTTKKCSFSID
jgi:hypothetical protein